MKVTGFDWDEGNWPKCGKHGVSLEESEEVLSGEPAVMPDPFPEEPRCEPSGPPQRAGTCSWSSCCGKSTEETRLRPISARYMHQKEIAHHEGTR